MNHVVRFLTTDDGEAVETNEQGDPIWGSEWHLVNSFGDAHRTLCGGEVFGFGEGAAEFEDKLGKITCDRCIEMVKFFKKVRL